MTTWGVVLLLGLAVLAGLRLRRRDDLVVPSRQQRYDDDPDGGDYGRRCS